MTRTDAQRAYDREWKRRHRAENPGALTRQYQTWGQLNPDKLVAYRKKWALENPVKVRDAGYRRNYGLTYEAVRQMWLAQESRCACCDAEIIFPHKSTHVDHCHVTGKVRGVVCHQCNAILGYARDSADTLRRAVAYLKGAK